MSRSLCHYVPYLNRKFHQHAIRMLYLRWMVEEEPERILRRLHINKNHNQIVFHNEIVAVFTLRHRTCPRGLWAALFLGQEMSVVDVPESGPVELRIVSVLNYRHSPNSAIHWTRAQVTPLTLACSLHQHKSNEISVLSVVGMLIGNIIDCLLLEDRSKIVTIFLWVLSKQIVFQLLPERHDYRLNCVWATIP